MNRLASETSLYLRQHAGNPVDWFPWGPEAIAEAKRRNVPIFLSVGYSACHWCHVMEHECFEHAGIAGTMNEHFVCVKVDREERPDLDSIYMAAHHALNRGDGGGWPLSVFLAPDLTPFYAGTYYPPDDRYAPQRPSFPRLLLGIADAWKTKPEQLLEIGADIAAQLAERGETATAGSVPPLETLLDALPKLKRSHDPVHGGFGTQPKFPHSVDLRVLLRIASRTGSAEAVGMVVRSLEKMARGGINDHVGGGFARYSVDAYWLVPHFEKMLYDNALLTVAYVEAYQHTGNDFFRKVACDTLDYVIREMTAPSGAFYSTQDADSEGEEGKFHVWSLDEVERVVGPELAELAVRTFGITEAGNFEGHNILFRAKSDEQDAAMLGLSVEDFRAKLDQVKCKLYGERAKRVWPGRDEKILTGWNGLMIAAFARAGSAFGEARYVTAATKAANFVLVHLRDPNGRLFRTCGDGKPAKLVGYLEDYAYLADGLLVLHEAGFDPKFVRAAKELTEVMLTHFRDGEAGGFFFTADDHEELICRTKDLHDNATPAANAVACTVLVKLAAITGDARYRTEAERIFAACADLMRDHPQAVAQLLLALDDHHGPIEEIAVIGTTGSEETELVLKSLRTGFHPRRTIAFHDPAEGEPSVELPLLAGKTTIDGRTTTYVCRNFACEVPMVGLPTFPMTKAK